MRARAVVHHGQNGGGGKMNTRFKLKTMAGLAGFVALLLAMTASAQEQQQGVCAPVRMQILQQLTLERVGFMATLTITDNTGNNPITDFAANLTFENPLLSSNGTVNDSSSQFFVQPPTFQNIQDVSGNGVIQPGQTATISWFIIPTVSSGGTNANGVIYNVAASLGGSVNGVAIPSSELQVIPAQITVAPDAQLQITYFTPRDTIGIDPYTGLGSPVPFTFGVLVQNVGYGPAQSVIINSQQPQIAANVQNLPLVAQLLGSRVNDSPLSNANLTVNLGNLNPGQTTKGAWDMITAISGTFLSVSATYTHSTALGGQETSLIQSVNAYLFLHEVLDDQPGRDSVRDFLTDTAGTLDAIDNLIPDSLYESQGGVYPVNMLPNAAVSGSGLSCQVNLSANIAGWGYMRLNDPNQAKLPIASVVRSDGKVLNTNNFWTSLHYEPITNFKDTYLNLFDLVGVGSYTYSVTYSNVPSSTNPPVTSLLFAGSSTYTNGIYYITPQTQMYFISQDVLPVEILYSLNSSPFAVAFPFSLTTPGTYQLAYYGSNTAGILEATHTATLVVPGGNSLAFAAVGAPSLPLFDPGAALSIRPTTVPISFQAATNPTALNAQIDIFQGVVGWATVSNMPSSPTSSTSAALTVGGQNVNFYMYQINSNAWSAEQPASSPLALSGLPSGTNTVSVLGRSQYGTYLPSSNALTVSWVVAPSAPSTTVTGAPATPAAANSAQLAVGGAAVTNYQWTIDGSYYRPPTNATAPLLLSNLSGGSHVVAVLGEVAGVYQSTNNPTTVAWTINPLYGYNMSSLPAVLSVAYTNIGGGTVTFNWAGTNAAGVIEPAGWYTARITLSDSLGDTNFAVVLVQIDALSGGSTVLANSSRGPQSPSARGRWAVWQDQSDGNWEIYAEDVTSNNPIVQVTHTPLSQENPRTDGRYIVWQAQQTNGNWDIYINDMESSNGPQDITSTPATDETYPAIDWPWVVYQARPTGNTSAPWQVFALNLATNLPPVAVSPTTQDELSPDVQAARVVWQDLRNPGAGEIYFYDLNASNLLRITTNLFAKLNPAICDNWIVWQDSRNTEVDIYGWDFLRQREIQITDTPENESQPYIDGPWVVCMENSLGPQTGNGRLIHLPSLVTIPITRTATLKTYPALADGNAVWQETISNQSQITAVALPSLQPVFQNRNVVAVTAAMTAYAQNAYGLLSDWGSNGVQSITEYTSLTPSVTSQTAFLTNGAPVGPNFSLVPGSFLWMQFNSLQVLDLGVNTSTAISLAAGANVFSYTGFPDAYSAFTLLQQIGLNNAQSVRMLDAESGRWRVAEVQGGSVVGDNFPIPATAVLMVNVTNTVNQFTPQSP
jgi:beta propeller repeat protein